MFMSNLKNNSKLKCVKKDKNCVYLTLVLNFKPSVMTFNSLRKLPVLLIMSHSKPFRINLFLLFPI